jgi:quercetin dioxygenase-like cupin family protein
METGVSYAAMDPDAHERFVPLRRLLGVTSFGMNQILLRPGQRGRIHRHRLQEEVYVVLAGSLTLLLEGEPHVLGPGDIARVAPDVRRQLLNAHPEELLLLALGGASEHAGRDGEAFATWEDTEPAPPQELPLPSDVLVP